MRMVVEVFFVLYAARISSSSPERGKQHKKKLPSPPKLKKVGEELNQSSPTLLFSFSAQKSV
jgi:hypothetical protein